MIEKLSKDDERRIIASLEKAVGLTNEGTDPSEALAKAASEERFSPEIVRRMVEAYNTSKTLAHMKKAKGPERAANFTLAEPEKVFNILYPKDVAPRPEKAAELFKDVTADVMTPNRYKPLEVKKAATYEKDKGLETLAARRKTAEAYTDKLSKARAAHQSAQHRMMTGIQKAASYFRRVGHIPFAEVECRLLGEYGKAGRALADLLHKHANSKEQRAEAPTGPVVFPKDKEPYSTIARAMEAAGDMRETAYKVAELEKESSGLGLGAASMAAAKGLGRMAAPLAGEPGPATYAEEKARALDELFDPKHEQLMAEIRAKAMLNDFLSNDEVISAYEPDQVMAAYNQIVAVYPRAAGQSVLMRGLLRKMLQQSDVLEPFDVQQLGTIEKTLMETKGRGKGAK